MSLQQIYSRSAQILQRFTVDTGSNMQVIYEPAVVSPWDRVNTLRYYGFITDLRMKVQISSIAESEIPNMGVESSRTDRLIAVRDMEWKSARKELELFLETSRQPLTNVARVSLLNRQPFYTINLLPYFTDNGVVNIANDARISARIKNAGYGLLQGSDEVVMYGSVKEEVTTLPEEEAIISSCQSHGWTIGTGNAQILPSNPNRLQLTLVNRGSEGTIFINYGNLAELGKGIALLPNGGSYEINYTNPYKGMISAVADSTGSQLSGMECV